jgi:hypothetical protein
MPRSTNTTSLYTTSRFSTASKRFLACQDDGGRPRPPTMSFTDQLASSAKQAASNVKASAVGDV